MNHRAGRSVLVPVLVLLLGFVFFAVLSQGDSRIALAQGGSGIVRVATTGGDASGCGSAATPCRTIQYAVREAAEGEEIRIAAGTYTGAQQVWAIGAGKMTTMTQVVIVTKSLTLRGGYTTTDWNTSVPTQNKTTIDAEGWGRGITIVGNGAQTVTIEGLTITGGDYTELGNPYAPGQCVSTNADCGGGLYAYQATVVIRSSVISDNVASRTSQSSNGGGVHLFETLAGTQIQDTVFANNYSGGDNANGGGVGVWSGVEITITGCSFLGNHASDMGGAVDVRVTGDGLALIDADEFISNSVTANWNGRGGAVYIRAGAALVRDSTFISNTGKNGGALCAQIGDSGDGVVLERNTFFRNSATQRGGGLSIGDESIVTLTNNVIAQNSSSAAAGVLIEGAAQATLLHNTIADNTFDTSGQGVRLLEEGTTAHLVNNIIVGHHHGLRVQVGVTLTADHTFFFGNDQDTYQPTGVLTSTNAITGRAPAFVDPSGFDYHLRCGSGAIDAGIDAGVAVDIDGDARPEGGGFDVGADEAITAGVCRTVFLPLALR